MRWTGWVFAAVVIGLAGPASGHQPGCAGCNGGMSPWDAEACASPPGYSLVPGCCEDHRRCCDNAWAGYCDHRAKVEACWSRVGTSAMYARPRPCRNAPMGPCTTCGSCPSPAMQPTPAVPSPDAAPAPPPTPAPRPAPDKGARSAYILRQW